MATSHSALSHLYSQFDDRVGVVLAARRAYEEDAYLDAANAVLWRLVTGLYDLQQFTEARRWCDKGGRRFPEDHRFLEGQLSSMTTHEVVPDLERALALSNRLTSPPFRELVDGGAAHAGGEHDHGVGTSAPPPVQ